MGTYEGGRERGWNRGLLFALGISLCCGHGGVVSASLSVMVMSCCSLLVGQAR